MNDKVSPDEPLPTRTESEGATVDLPEGLGFFTTGQVLGERYEILEMLGRGGMGEVWRAFDLKLRVEVGLKALREELFQSERRLELLRQEVRAAREVLSPNVCRIFDLIEIDGRELVSMEYVDGATLLGVLQERGPLELKEAQDIASQFLAGLEAIHKAGLVHRDVKPENIMLTRAGRVVVMDFGLARGPESGAGSVSGTPAYMAPEHAAGQEVDARADVYSAGVVLAEMVSPEGIRSYESRQSVWEGVRSEPAQVPDSPWAAVIKRAVARDRERRQNSAHTLIRELEDVTLRVEGADDLHPYPGLASFTEDDAEYFFGREAEVERMWRKLEGPPRLLGIAGPSGAGKTSFIRAGLTPNAPSDWSIIRCTPGNAAIASLRGALTPELPSDSAALQGLVTDPDNPDVIVDAATVWREGRGGALLIIDQFEELFTLNPDEDQKRFAALLGRLPLEADVHVVVSMRDDFAAACGVHEALQPVFHELTMLNPPTGGNLRRALVQPATKCGYRFEDDELVEEILAEVEGERGALPLLAFALARLWEKRDRDSGLLTRQAYHDIGGVGGALARHAEATVDRIGVERIPIVRELFRNLVTAEGTRAVREWDELLSVFGGTNREGINPSPTNQPDNTMGTGTTHGIVGASLRSNHPSAMKTPIVGEGFIPSLDAASDVLRNLIDARLLTSYEVREDEHEPTRRVEIIHESLLANWPRLVRWQTQDAEGAQLRDELRQSARAWDEHGRHDDRLWTGTAFREFAVWRERYPGGLTETEEAFGAAMTRCATRRKRRRRVAVAAAFATLLAVLVVIGSFWRRSLDETRRAEAANLFSLAQLQLEDDPSAAIAYAIASLERADSTEMRRLALDAVSRGPTEFRLPAGSVFSLDFSPDGRWLAATDHEGRGMLWPSDGGPPTALEGEHPALVSYFSPRGDLVAAVGKQGEEKLRLWSAPDSRLLRVFDLGQEGFSQWFKFSPDGLRLITHTETLVVSPKEVKLRSWPIEGGEPSLVARLTIPVESTYSLPDLDPDWSQVSWIDGRTVFIAPLKDGVFDPTSARKLVHDRAVVQQIFDREGRRLASFDQGGTARIWSLESDPPQPIRSFSTKHGVLTGSGLAFEPSGSLFFGANGLWDLTAPRDAEPFHIRRSGFVQFIPNGSWIATSESGPVSMWPLTGSYPRVLRGHEANVTRLTFTPSGKHLVSGSEDGTVRVWPLDGGTNESSHILVQLEGGFAFPRAIAMSPDGSFVVIGNAMGMVRVQPLDGGPARELSGLTGDINRIAVGPRSRLVAARSRGIGTLPVLVWDLASDKVFELDAGDDLEVNRFQFAPDGDLWVWSRPVLRRWRLADDEARIVEEFDLSGPGWAGDGFHGFDPDRRMVLVCKDDKELWFQDLDSREARELTTHPHEEASLHADHEIVISWDGLGGLLVGPSTGEEPHLLLGHGEGFVYVSPDGRWIASRGEDLSTIKLWPMPDLTKIPHHILPRSELIAKLKTLTNLRVVPDEESRSGWKLEVGPFPGWETVPAW